MRFLNTRFSKILLATSFLWSVNTIVVNAAEPQDYSQENLSLTLYQNNFAQIQASRKFNMGESTSVLQWHNLPKTMLQDSFEVTVEGQDISDLRRPLKANVSRPVLEQYVGQKLIWDASATTNSETSSREGMLLALTNDGPIVQFEDGIEINPVGIIKLPYAPATPSPNPYMDIVLANEINAPIAAQASYLAKELYWAAQYKAELDRDMENLTLSSMIRIGNETDRDFLIDQLALVAGDVQLNPRQSPDIQEPKLERAMALSAASVRSDVVPIVSSPVNISDRYVFPVSGTKDLPAQTEIKFNFFDTVSFPINTTYQLDWRMPWGVVSSGDTPAMRPETIVEFENKEDIGLGMALPEGDIRFVRAAPEKQLGEFFVAEDYLGNTAKNQNVQFRLGQTFDITAKHIQTDFKNISDDHRRFETAYDVKLTNAKDKAITVTLRDFMPGKVEVIEANAKYNQTSTQSINWTVNIPANGEFVLSYRVRVGG